MKRKMKESQVGKREKRKNMVKGHVFILFYLAKVKDTLSTDAVYLLGQPAFYCILLYCIVLCHVWKSVHYYSQCKE